ncbi:MAG: long-chain-fatty-acid--CoA ligase [Phycisphaerales bacterium]|nr:long-chain-fatty-acid--CoA ligase [Phycisphaerales bacterium]
MQTLDWAVRHAALMYPEQEAVTDGETRLTFLQFADRCKRLGSVLASMEIRRGDRVAVLLTNSHRYLELHFAVPGIGAVIVPLNSRLAIPELEYILEDSGASLLVTDDAHAALARQLIDKVPQVLVVAGEYEQRLAAAKPHPLPGPSSDEDLAGLYYTGGTTGPGKGVMLSHRNLIMTTMQLAIAFEMRPDFVFLHVFPLFHLAAIASVYALTWLGVRQVFVPAAEPGLLLDTIARERITHSSIVPTVLNLMLNHPKAATADLSSLQQITHGGAPISPDLCRRAVSTAKCRFVQGYGMTESAGLATFLHGEHLLLDHERIASAGRVIAGMELVVRRPDGAPCRAREHGEITLRGPNIMRGYWKRPEQTAAALRDGWYWTGDLGWADEDNYIFIVDRAKDMIVSGGENVYSVEVEAVIASHPAVFEVVVIGIPSEIWGEQVHAIVRLKADAATSEAEIIAHCRGRVAGYKCPKSVSFSATELPKSGAGKVLKRDLRAPYWSVRDRHIA